MRKLPGKHLVRRGVSGAEGGTRTHTEYPFRWFWATFGVVRATWEWFNARNLWQGATRSGVILALVAGAIVLPSAPAAVAVPPPRVVVEAKTHRAHEVKFSRPILFSAVGDSITAGYGGIPSWTTFADTQRTDYLFGWSRATGGAYTYQMAAGYSAADSPADVLVLMGCTNDMIAGWSVRGCLDNWDIIAATNPDMPIVLSAIAPSNYVTAATVMYNAAAKVHAAERGWIFVDPWVTVRQADGTWVPGGHRGDLIHPSAASAEIAGAILGDAIWNVANGRKLI